MWDDRFLFVLASLAAIGLSFSVRQSNVTTRRVAIGAVLIGVIGVLGTRSWLYWDSGTEPQKLGAWAKLDVPNLGSAAAALIGAIFGTFTARFVGSLFGSQFGRRDPVVGVLVLALLIIVYSLCF
jgi:hypothetical protein